MKKMEPKLKGCSSTAAEIEKRGEAGPHHPPAMGHKELRVVSEEVLLGWVLTHRAKGEDNEDGAVSFPGG